ncbi:MAG TPA: glycosyltransferase, partial [Tianweitania sediminis]|nr:glycosyltransferase [Tianweitania sediminis]
MSSAIIAELRIQGQLLVGWVIDPKQPDRRFVVEVDCDDQALMVARAEAFLPHLRDAGHGDGCYGFAVTLDEPDSGRKPFRRRYTLRIANTSLVLASVSPSLGPVVEPVSLGGHVVWRGGLRLSGILHGFQVREISGGLQVFEGSSRIDAVVSHSPSSESERDSAFDLFLPAGLADGALHTIRVLDPNGAELDGSPLWIVADLAGFRGLADRALAGLKERDALRDRLLDHLDLLVPASLPFDGYSTWFQKVEEPEDFGPTDDPMTVGIVIIGRSAQEVTVASLREQVGGVSVRVGILDTDDHGRFTAEAWSQLQKALLRGVPLKAVLVVRGGTSFNPKACRLLGEAFSSGDHPPGVVFADHTLFNGEGLTVPVLAPAFDYERMLSQGYGEGLFALSPGLMEQVRFNDVFCNAYDVLFAALEQAAPSLRDKVAHLPRVLANVPQRPPQLAALLLKDAVQHHCVRIGIIQDVEATAGQTYPVVRLRRPQPEGQVEIIIPTRDRLDLLKPCLTTLFERTEHPHYQVTVIDNGSVERETRAYLTELEQRGAIKILRDDGPFNYSRLNNRAVGHST